MSSIIEIVMLWIGWKILYTNVLNVITDKYGLWLYYKCKDEELYCLGYIIITILYIICKCL